MISMESPDERPVKFIIVALWDKYGMLGWRLVAARKIDRFYVADKTAFDGISNQVRPFEQDRFGNNPAFRRPYATYREFGASKTISDTGPVPIK